MQAFAALLPSHPGWRERRERDASDDRAGEVWEFLRAVAAVAASPSAAPAPDDATAGGPR